MRHADLTTISDSHAHWIHRDRNNHIRDRVWTERPGFHDIATVAENQPAQIFLTLAMKFATVGGINGQVLAQLTQVGALKAISDALDDVIYRMTEPKPAG